MFTMTEEEIDKLQAEVLELQMAKPEGVQQRLAHARDVEAWFNQNILDILLQLRLARQQLDDSTIEAQKKIEIMDLVSEIGYKLTGQRWSGPPQG